MRLKLYELEIERAEGTVRGHIVAANEKKAVAMVVDHDLALDVKHLSFSLKRVDTKLPDDRQAGLEPMLSAPINGFASYLQTIGWIVNWQVSQRLRFFKVFTPQGEVTRIVAVDEDEAADIYCNSYVLHDGEHQLFKIVDGLPELPPEHREGLASILEFGPRGVAIFDPKSGWSILPRA